MSKLIEYDESQGEVREIFNDIRATRKSDEINNFWKALANHPPTLKRTWQAVKEVMSGPGLIDPLTRELLYIAVSVTNNCNYCIASHSFSANAKGMTEPMFGDLMAIVAVANMTNRLANGYNIPIDERFQNIE